jgi:hypothetical protein
MNNANDKDLPKPPVGGGANSLCAIAFMQSKVKSKVHSKVRANRQSDQHVDQGAN